MPKASIRGEERRIADVFSDDFVFSIPVYQRPYAWTQDEAGELLEDVSSFMTDRSTPVDELNPYFLGSIVLVKADDSADAEVVDGQQRLLTLTILFSVLRELASGEKKKSQLSRFIVEEANPYYGTENRYRLTTRQRDSEFFLEYIQKKLGIGKLCNLQVDDLSDSEENIRQNAVHYHDALSSYDEEQRDRLAQFLGQRCYLVVVSTTDRDSAYRIFSVLNDRGLDLSHADILKSDVIGAIDEAEQLEYANKWEQAEEYLGREAFEALFAHIRMIYCKAKLSETVLKEFREHVVPKHTPKKLIDEVLVPYTEAYADTRRAAFKAASPHTRQINRTLSWLNQIDNVDWIPPALACLNGYQDQPDDILRFLKDLERLAASMMIRRVYRTSRIGRYGDLLKDMEKGADLYRDGSPLQLTKEERRKTVDQLDGAVYTLRNVPKYVLLRLDDFLSDEGATYDHAVISTEHVLPQTPAAKSEWLRVFPDDKERQELTHRLGNLVLLSRRKNSRAQNYDFKVKKNRYFATTNEGASPFVLTNQVIQEDFWTPDVVRKRQLQLLGKLKDLWRL